MTKDHLIALALRFRACRLWEMLDDSLIFGVSLPGGMTGYCCVMGNGGEHYALGLYRGVAGFTTYMNSLNCLVQVDSFEMMQTYDSLNCDFESSSDSNLTPAEKKHVRAVAAEHGLKISRPKGFPEFVRYDHGLVRTEMDENEAADLAVALEAAIDVADKVKGKDYEALERLGFFTEGYVSRDGGQSIPLLEKQPDGTFAWTSTLTPEAEEEIFAPVAFENPGMAERVRRLPVEGKLQCKVMHLPSPVKSADGIYYPVVMVLVNPRGMVFPLFPADDASQPLAGLLDQLGSLLEEGGKRPGTLLVDDRYTESVLKDFCERTGIGFEMKDFLPSLEEVVFALRNGFYTGMPR